MKIKQQIVFSEDTYMFTENPEQDIKAISFWHDNEYAREIEIESLID